MKLLATLFFFSCLIASSLALGKVPGSHPMGLNLDRAHRAPAEPADVGVVAAGEVAVVNAFSTRGGGGVDLKSVKFTTVMVPYFAFFALGLALAPEQLFGGNSIIKMSYFSGPVGAVGTMFARIAGVGLGLLAGAPYLGVAENAYTKLSLGFHVGTLPVIILAIMDGSPFNAQVWYLQLALNALLLFWGYKNL